MLLVLTVGWLVVWLSQVNGESGAPSWQCGCVAHISCFHSSSSSSNTLTNNNTAGYSAAVPSKSAVQEACAPANTQHDAKTPTASTRSQSVSHLPTPKSTAALCAHSGVLVVVVMVVKSIG